MRSSSSSTQLSAPPRVALIRVGILFLYCALRDLRPTPATETAAPRTRTSEARVMREAGEDIVERNWLDGLCVHRKYCSSWAVSVGGVII